VRQASCAKHQVRIVHLNSWRIFKCFLQKIFTTIKSPVGAEDDSQGKTAQQAQPLVTPEYFHLLSSFAPGRGE
jgi:hypothetical protein